jgi:PhnB protein
MQVQPYLIFEGRCEEAIEFYKKALGAKVEMLMRFKDNPEPQGDAPGCAPGAGQADKVMHAALKIGDTTVMCSDGMASNKPNFQGFSLSLDAKDEKDAKRMYAALGEGGGKEVMPLGKTFYSPCFGMVADRFGVNWMVIVPQKM